MSLQTTLYIRLSLIWVFVGLWGCGRVTGTIDDPYHLSYNSTSKQGNYVYFENAEIRFRSGRPGGEAMGYPITNATKNEFELSVTSPAITGKFMRQSDKGCEGNPATAYKEVILYNLTLEYHGEAITSETYHGIAGCE